MRSAGGAGPPPGRPGTNGNRAAPPATNGTSPPAPVTTGRCRCGLPGRAACEGCGRAACGEHLLNRASRLAWPGPYQSEREHTAYLRAFWLHVEPRCTWCREEAGRAAVAALPAVPALPEDPIERLAALLRRPHDYPGDAWAIAVRTGGGAAAVVRRLAPSLHARKPVQEFPGRRSGEVMVGVALARPGPSGHEVVDGAGVVWTVRPLSSSIVRKRRAWSWERTDDARLEALLPGMVEQAWNGGPPK